MEEIKPSDLMIGNYIRDIHSENGFFKVITLRKCTAIYGNFYSARYEDLRGIPLTEDVLFKCGFKLDNNKNYWLSLDLDKHLDLIQSEGYYYPQLVQEPEMSCDNLSVVSLNRISALHELQTLFFILSGSHLVINI